MASHTYEVYATRWDNPNVVDELIPARGLEFSLPLSDHGEASFTATVEAGGSLWRPSIALPVSGVLIARDGVPAWQGWVTAERPAGPRSFQFSAREWGYFFEEKVPAVPRSWVNADPHLQFRQLLSDAQAIAGQNIQVRVPTTSGSTYSTRTVNAWDITTVGREQRSISEADGGPEWYYGTTGTIDHPIRQLFLADRLGLVDPADTLEYVEDLAPAARPDEIPTVVLLSDLFPGSPTVVPTRRAGGNLLAQGRTRVVGDAATVADGVGPGSEQGAILGTPLVAQDLLDAGWPRMTSRLSYSDIMPAVNGRYYVPAVKRRLAAAIANDLASKRGIATTYALVARDSVVDWTKAPRGSTMQVILDTDIYGAEQPVGGPDGFEARLFDTVVRVQDDGDAQVEYNVATVMEV